jgi:hypothetical protein
MPKLCSCIQPRLGDESNICMRCGGIPAAIEGIDGEDDQEQIEMPEDMQVDDD